MNETMLPPPQPEVPHTNDPTSGYPVPIPPAMRPVVGGKPTHKWRKWLIMFLVVLLIAGGVLYILYGRFSKTPHKTSNAQVKSSQISNSKLPGLQLITAKNYGDKYANGLLPVGDGKYVTTGAKQGVVYACSDYARNLATQPGGAGTRGPWFTSDGTQYDLHKKVQVEGNVMWKSNFTDTVSADTRTIISNDLPNHPTGVFPIATTDPAYAFDRNPNSIMAQSFTYDLAANPSYGNPHCVDGQVGVMLAGVALFSAFDAGGHDAGAWEVQDSCSGHPEKDGIYHYHTLSACIKDTSVNTVIGYALDGFPITGPKVGPDNILTTSDLDECHGITSQIIVDGKTTTSYHYVMTQDFPYSVSCFRAKAIQPPGQQASGLPQPPL